MVWLLHKYDLQIVYILMRFPGSRDGRDDPMGVSLELINLVWRLHEMIFSQELLVNGIIR